MGFACWRGGMGWDRMDGARCVPDRSVGEWYGVVWCGGLGWDGGEMGRSLLELCVGVRRRFYVGSWLGRCALRVGN